MLARDAGLRRFGRPRGASDGLTSHDRSGMSDQTTSATFHRSERAGSPLLVIVLAALLVAAAVAFSLLGQAAGALIIGLLALLAVIGIFALFGYAAGLFQFAGRAVRNDLTRVVCDSGPEGLLVTDHAGKFLYANETYLKLSGARGAADLRGVERLFSGSPEVSEAVYRLAQASRDGKKLTEELRLLPPLDPATGSAGWYRVRVRPISLPEARRASLWSIADVTRERERHENVFQELQHAIDFLDHAPAGFFSCNDAGDVSYMNATLASWLDYDLAQVGSGGLEARRFRHRRRRRIARQRPGGAGRGPHRAVRHRSQAPRRARIAGASAAPRRLRRRRCVRARLGRLVISRLPGEEPGEDLRAAEVRFARVFNATPRRHRHHR